MRGNPHRFESYIFRHISEERHNMGTNVIDETGNRFGRLTVLEKDHVSKWGNVYWKCLCDCGKERITLGRSLRGGETISCGCYRTEVHKARAIHGKGGRDSKNNPYRGMYQSWADAKQRCSNPKIKAYRRYGGRGIVVCERWQSFKNFDEDMKEGWSQGMTLDRIDSDGNYEPGNCQWLTLSENSRKGR